MKKTILTILFLNLFLFSCSNRSQDNDVEEDYYDLSSDTGSDDQLTDTSTTEDNNFFDTSSDNISDDIQSNDDTNTEPLQPEELMALVDKNRYISDVEFIAQERVPGSDHWQAVQDLCYQTFTDLGFETERYNYGSGVDVIGKLPGNTSNDAVIVSAHYDHIEDCPGADDNATGVAGVLEIARILVKSSYSRTLILACWDEEEDGTIGSQAYVKRASQQGEQIIVSFVYDMIGYKSDETNSQEVPYEFDLISEQEANRIKNNGSIGDFMIILPDETAHNAAKQIENFAATVGLPTAFFELTQDMTGSYPFNNMLQSDHTSFWQYNYPAMFLSDTAYYRNPNFHCMDGFDSTDTLNYDFAVQIVKTTIGAAATVLNEN